MLLKKEILRKILILFFPLIVLLFVINVIISEVIKTHPDTMQKAISDTFNRIRYQLEFEGLSNATKDITRNYSHLFNDYSNIIITDDSGSILFSINSGFISEKNKFLVLADPWKMNDYGRDIAYLIDKNNKIKYTAELGISININALRELSSRNPLSKVLYSRTTEYEDTTKDKKIVNSDGTFYIVSADTKIILDYEYVASKGYNLYALYDSDHQYNNYYRFVSTLHIIKQWLTILMIAILILFWALLPVWVFKDALGRKMKMAFWTIVTLLTNLLGFGLYMIFRTRYSQQAICVGITDDNLVICPNCGEKIITGKVTK